MSLKFGKRDVAKMANALDQDYESLEDAAAAALEAAMDIIAAKAKYTVVGQILWAGETLDPSDPRAEKVALGWYGTEKQALDDALKLTYSTQTHEQARAWVLPVHHGTPNDWYKDRKVKSKADEAADKSDRERELQRRIEWCNDHPDEPMPEEWGAIPHGEESAA